VLFYRLVYAYCRQVDEGGRPATEECPPAVVQASRNSTRTDRGIGLEVCRASFEAGDRTVVVASSFDAFACKSSPLQARLVPKWALWISDKLLQEFYENFIRRGHLLCRKLNEFLITYKCCMSLKLEIVIIIYLKSS